MPIPSDRVLVKISKPTALQAFSGNTITGEVIKGGGVRISIQVILGSVQRDNCRVHDDLSTTYLSFSGCTINYAESPQHIAQGTFLMDPMYDRKVTLYY